MLATPYIPDEIGLAPADFPWKGVEYHIGPVEEVTPFIKWLGNKTTCGVQSICSGVMLWGARRLEALTEAGHNFELAEAGFAGQTNRYLVDVQAGPMSKVPDRPPADSAMIGLNKHLRRALDMDEWWDSYFQPVMDLSHMVHIVRTILSGDHLAAFDAWLATVVERVNSVAAKPATPELPLEEFNDKEAFLAYNAPHRGTPLPPDILDTTKDFAPAGMEDRARGFATSLSPRSNRYIRTPDEMRRLAAEERT